MNEFEFWRTRGGSISYLDGCCVAERLCSVGMYLMNDILLVLGWVCGVDVGRQCVGCC